MLQVDAGGSGGSGPHGVLQLRRSVLLLLRHRLLWSVAADLPPQGPGLSQDSGRAAAVPVVLLWEPFLNMHVDPFRSRTAWLSTPPGSPSPRCSTSRWCCSCGGRAGARRPPPRCASCWPWCWHGEFCFSSVTRHLDWIKRFGVCAGSSWRTGFWTAG